MPVISQHIIDKDFTSDSVVVGVLLSFFYKYIIKQLGEEVLQRIHYNEPSLQCDHYVSTLFQLQNIYQMDLMVKNEILTFTIPAERRSHDVI